MTLTLDDDDQSLRITVLGALRWNDRLLVSALARHFRVARAGRAVLDASGATEQDRGCFEGIAQTARRMTLLAGLALEVVPPGAAREAAA